MTAPVLVRNSDGSVHTHRHVCVLTTKHKQLPVGCTHKNKISQIKNIITHTHMHYEVLGVS